MQTVHKNYPEEIEKTRLEVIKLNAELDDLREGVGRIHDATCANIASALNESGKPVFSNEDKRRAAITQELDANEIYTAAFAKIKELETLRECLNAKLERLRGEHKDQQLSRREAINESDSIE